MKLRKCEGDLQYNNSYSNLSLLVRKVGFYLSGKWNSTFFKISNWRHKKGHQDPQQNDTQQKDNSA
jgi:hypothetical protein